MYGRLKINLTKISIGMFIFNMREQLDNLLIVSNTKHALLILLRLETFIEYESSLYIK